MKVTMNLTQAQSGHAQNYKRQNIAFGEIDECGDAYYYGNGKFINGSVKIGDSTIETGEYGNYSVLKRLNEIKKKNIYSARSTQRHQAIINLNDGTKIVLTDMNLGHRDGSIRIKTGKDSKFLIGLANIFPIKNVEGMTLKFTHDNIFEAWFKKKDVLKVVDHLVNLVKLVNKK